ncbi:MAG: hypothetical protein HYU41_27365 [Candidatus Rokubacteria bacterium]|nr:hypothetical protein [Candidatus Rokubacteria bacterium]
MTLLRWTLPLLAMLLLTTSRPAFAGPDLVLPSDQYSSAKAKRLAAAHSGALSELGATLYHCLPWLEVQRHSLGFFRPKHATADDRYLSVRVFVEQEPSPTFARLSPEERASAMFSRYVGHLIRRMARSRAMLEDSEVAGFTIIVEWLKQDGAVNGRPVHETIAAFIPTPVAIEYLNGRVGVSGIARRARVLGFDGERALGEIRLAAWEDDFASTYQLKNYALPAGVDCRVSR